MQFHKNLKRLRQQKDLTQTALAEKLNLVQSTYHRYEIGAREPDLNTIIKLANFYNVSLDELFGYEPKNGQTSDQEKYIYKSNKHKKLHGIIDILNDDLLNRAEWFLTSLVEMQETNQLEKKA